MAGMFNLQVFLFLGSARRVESETTGFDVNREKRRNVFVRNRPRSPRRNPTF